LDNKGQHSSKISAVTAHTVSFRHVMHNRHSDNKSKLTTVSPLAKMVLLVSASMSGCFGTPRRLATRCTLLWSGISVASKLSDETSKCTLFN
jgi:hypothetical protein